MRISDWSSDVCSSDLQSLADVILNDLAPSKEKSAPSSISLPALHPSSLVEDQAQPAFATRKVTSPPDDGISIFVAIRAKMEKRVGVATTNWSPSRRSEGRRVGNECVRTGRYRWA